MTPEHLGSLQNILAFLRENGFARSEASLVEEVRSLLEKAELEKAALDEAASDPARSRSRSPPRRTAAPPPSDDGQLPLSPPHVPPPPARLARFGSDVEQLASDLAANAERPDALAGRARAPPSVVSAATDDFASALEEPTADPPESPRADPGPRKSLAAAVDRLAIDDDRPSDDDEHLSDDDEDDREDVRSASASASASASSRSPRSTASSPSRAWHERVTTARVLTGAAAAA